MTKQELKIAIQESIKRGEQVTKDYKDLEVAIENRTIAKEDILKSVVKVETAYNEWEEAHKKLMFMAHDISYPEREKYSEETE